MPLVAHNKLPTFNRLNEEGQTILQPERATQQDIREQHIGLLNMMPDAALAATERQFYRLIGESNPIVQIYIHPFTLPVLPRGEKAQKHIDTYYETFEDLKQEGLDALIITGANVTQANLSDEIFWKPLTEVVEWATNNVVSTLCSCLATHAVMEFRHGQKRRHLQNKRWGVYPHKVTLKHPLVRGINSKFDVPHSRFNQIDRKQFEQAKAMVLVESEEAGVQLAVSKDGLRLVYFQGHPEYDAISLLKEYKREVFLFMQQSIDEFPPFPANYFDQYTQSIFEEFRERVLVAMNSGSEMPEFPESLIVNRVHNTWHDTGEAIVGKWLGLVYQYTNPDRRLHLMDGVDPGDPLGLAI
jgi:homoserine O-succinyltransferase